MPRDGRVQHDTAPGERVPDTCLAAAEAVPKRILDLMNVEGLTRENVASHLQVTAVSHPTISHGGTSPPARVVLSLSRSR